MIRYRFLRWCAETALTRPKICLGACLLVTAASLWMAMGLGFNFQWTELVPQDEPIISDLTHVHGEFASGSGYIVVITSDDPAKLEAAVDDAESLIPDIAPPLRLVISGVPEDFMVEHGLGTLDPEGLERAEKLLASSDLVANLAAWNDLLEDDYSDDSDRLEDDQRPFATMMRTLGEWAKALERATHGDVDAEATRRSLRNLTTGDPYLRSLDGSTALILIAAQGSPGDMSTVIPVDLAMDEVYQELRRRHPGVVFERTGIIPLARDEMASLGGSTYLLSALAIALAYLILALAFRDLLTPVLATLPLILGIVWSMGFFAVTVEDLNIMTAVIMMVLVGLGIDFSIHLVGRYQEERSAGQPLEVALHRTWRETGQGVVTGALTTALAFLALTVADTPGIREFGFCAGFGVVLTLTAVLVILPCLLVERDRRLQRSLASQPMSSLGALAASAGAHPIRCLAFAVITMGVGFGIGSANSYEYNMLELQPQGARSVQLQSEIVDRFGLSMEVSYVTAETVQESRRLADAFADLKTVGAVDDISQWIPAASDTAGMAASIARIRSAPGIQSPREVHPSDPEFQRRLSEEVSRLEANCIELGDLAYVSGLDRVVEACDRVIGNDQHPGAISALASRFIEGTPNPVNWNSVAELSRNFSSGMVERVEHMTRVRRSVTYDDLPPRVKERYISSAGDEYLVTLMPEGFIYDLDPLEKFSADVASVHPNVAGTPQLILLMNQTTLTEGRKASVAALLAILALLLLDFRRLDFTLFALVPLIVAIGWTLGAMFLLDLRYNFVNMIAVPILLGIGVDDGVHFVHRLRLAQGSPDLGAGLREAGASVGRAIFLTSVTTIAGFGSIALYPHRGMASLGVVLALGVAACFGATVLALPPLLQIRARGRGPMADTTLGDASV